MGKSLQHVTQRKQKRGGTPGGKPISHARSLGEARKRRNQVEAIWESFPEGLIACDRHQKIVRINAAARKLFEVVSKTQCQGRNHQHFLTSYISSDEQLPCASREQWLMNLALAGTTGTGLPEQMLLHLPSGCKISVTVRTFPVSAHRCDTEETVSVFHWWQESFSLQRVQESMLDLLAAITQIPKQMMDHVLLEETFLLSSPMLFVAQQLVNVIQSVLDCLHVNMLAFGRRTSHLYFVAGSGRTAEQEQYWRDIGGHFHSTECSWPGGHVLVDLAYSISGNVRHVPLPSGSIFVNTGCRCSWRFVQTNWSREK